MSLLTHLSADEQATLGPKTCAYLGLPHSHANEYRLRLLVELVFTERRKEPLLGEGWQSGTLALLLGNVIDYHKTGKLTTGRADQYRAEGRAATSARTLLRLLVTLHFETYPTDTK